MKTLTQRLGAIALALGALAGSAKVQAQELIVTVAESVQACLNVGKSPVYSQVDGFVGCKSIGNISGAVSVYDQAQEGSSASTEDNLTPSVVNPASNTQKPRLSSGLNPLKAQGASTYQTGFQTQDRATGLMTQSSQKDALLPLMTQSVNLYGTSISVGPIKTPYDTGLRVAATVPNQDNTFAGGIEVITSPVVQSYFAALGFRVTADVTGVVTISAVSESAKRALANDAYDGDISAQSASVALYHGSGFFRWLHETGKSRQLTQSISYTTTVEYSELETVLREITTTTKTTTDTLWQGYSRNTVTGGTSFDVGESSVLTLQGGVSQDPYNTRPVAGATFDTYYGTWKSTIGAYGSTDVQSISAGVSGQISGNLNWETRINHTRPSGGASPITSGSIGLRYQWGGNNNSAYIRPSSKGTPGAGEVLNRTMYDATLRPRPSSLGKVEIKQITETTQISKDINKSPQPIKASSIQAVINDDATVSVTLTNTRTGWAYEYQLDAGSWTLIEGASFRTSALSTGAHRIGVREKNPTSGEVSATTEISPTLQVDTPTNTTTQSVTVTSTTATIPRSLSDKDGIKDYTCQAYSGSTPIGSLVSATDTSCNLSGLAPSTSYLFVEKALTAQKKPNGDIVWVVREVRTPFTTSTPDNIPGTISTPTVQSKTYNSITLNTVTASADISDIMYVLLDATGTEVRRSATPLFVGLSASTTYRAHIEYKDKNESTNLQEVKVTPDVTVITDAPADATPPSLTSSTSLGAANIGTISNNNLTFSEPLNSASVTGTLPAGLTVTLGGTGSTRTLQLSTDAVFSAFGVVPISLAVTDVAGNPAIITVNISISDVAPIQPTIARVVTIDDGGSPITLNVGKATDILGRTFTSTLVSVTGPNGPVTGFTLNAANGTVTGSYDVGTVDSQSLSDLIFVIQDTLPSGKSSQRTVVVGLQDVG